MVLTPGPDSEQLVIREIYRAFVEEGRSEREIADHLNQRGVKTDLARLWTRGTVHQVLINEKYIGNNVWNRTSGKLKQPRIRNPSERWIRADGVFTPVVDQVLFRAAQAIIHSRSQHWSDEQMLATLKVLFEQRGFLSGLLIDEQEGCPSSRCYRSRFGSLLRSYTLIGYSPARDYSYLEANRRLRELHPRMLEDTQNLIREAGCEIAIDPRTQLVWVNGELSVSVVLCRCQDTANARRRWKLHFDLGLLPDLTVAVRMLPGEEDVFDYYVFPMIDLVAPHLRLGEANPRELDVYRFDSLAILSELTRRIPILRAA
ncbi:Recombinase [compost metagenome]